MIGDLVEAVLEGWLHDRVRPGSPVRLITRLLFGVLGATLSIAGAVKFGLDSQFTQNAPLRWSITGMFVSLAGFFVFNIMLSRTWRWPILFFILSFILLFVTRILFGP